MLVKHIIHKAKNIIKTFEIEFLKERAARYNLSLVAHPELPYNEIVIENYFKTNFSKNALLSYIIYPFLGHNNNNHSNLMECYSMAQILQELGYNVDIINWDNDAFEPNKHYDVVIDNHNNLSRLSAYFFKDTLRIFHATNTHWLFQNSVEYKRHHEYYLKTGVAVPPSRLIPPGNSIAYCDVITMFGNKFTRETYGNYSSKVHHLPISITSEPEFIISREYDTTKMNFLWLNSHGFLLKGLDIVIEAFAECNNLNLYICADLTKDLCFYESIKRLLDSLPNVHIMEWMDVSSNAFSELAANCSWVINTSFSEGGGGSTLNCMAKGLIPVISKSSSISLPDNTGFYLEENTSESLQSLIIECALLSNEDVTERSLNTYQYVLENHTLNNFKRRYKEFVVEMLSRFDSLNKLE